MITKIPFAITAFVYIISVKWKVIIF